MYYVCISHKLAKSQRMHLALQKHKIGSTQYMRFRGSPNQPTKKTKSMDGSSSRISLTFTYRRFSLPTNPHRQCLPVGRLQNCLRSGRNVIDCRLVESALWVGLRIAPRLILSFWRSLAGAVSRWVAGAEWDIV